MIRIRPKTGQVHHTRDTDRDSVLYLRDREDIQWDAGKSPHGVVCLDSSMDSRVLSFPHGVEPKTRYTLEIRQDSIGGAVLNFDPRYLFPYMVSLSTDPFAHYRIEFLSKSSGDILESISIKRLK